VYKQNTIGGVFAYFIGLSIFYGGTSTFPFLWFGVSSFFQISLFQVNSHMFTVWFGLSANVSIIGIGHMSSYIYVTLLCTYT